MTLEDHFNTVFHQATGLGSPYRYQRDLAVIGETVPRLLDVPTGLGKTAAVVFAWLWRRRFANQDIRKHTPRRLVYCLPMRVLVEQTFAETVRWLDRLGVLAGRATWKNTQNDGLPTRSSRLVCYQPDPADESPVAWASQHGDQGTHRIAVHLLMGGEQRTDWALWPERDAILIGTQDMLLSRALNRGYAARRARWPMEFGLLTNDCLWIFDEIQLMGSGLSTSSQLDCFMSKLWNPMIENQFLWMSATIDVHGLQTRDRQDLGCTTGAVCSVTAADRRLSPVQTRLRAEKEVIVAQKPPRPTQRDGWGILDRHVPGRLTLVVLNTVQSAIAMVSQLRTAVEKAAKKKGGPPQPEICLLHSRFRPCDRRIRMNRVLDFTDAQDTNTGPLKHHPGLVLVATQVVEAGLDISACHLWSEVAPWASCVQRLGRLNREGKQLGATAVFWKPKAETKGENAKGAPNANRVGPYEKGAIDAAQSLLSKLAQLQQKKPYRDALDEISATNEAQSALRFELNAVIRPDDMHDLFSTEPDLAGGFTDISQFVRDQDRNVDVHVFWREFDPKRGPSPDEPAPVRDELCPVPFYEFRRFLGDKQVAWEWDFEAGQWVRRRRRDVFPGMTLMLARGQGGYSNALGWTGDPADRLCESDGVFQFAQPHPQQPDALEFDPTSFSGDWLPLPDHLNDVHAATDQLVKALGLAGTVEGKALLVAARWHDWGKALPRFQEAVARYVERVVARCDAILKDPRFADLHAVVHELRRTFEPPNWNSIWAKWPNIRNSRKEPMLRDCEESEVLSLLNSQFRSGLRHEAASALAAWEVWCAGSSEMTALAVYLIASHHGKVRTVLRRIHKKDEVFGLRQGDTLPAVAGCFPTDVALLFDARRVGMQGEWQDDGRFVPVRPSWSHMLSELLGPVLPDDPWPCDAIPEGEPRRLGPFKLAYLEAILRAADGRASQQPGTGGR